MINLKLNESNGIIGYKAFLKGMISNVNNIGDFNNNQAFEVGKRYSAKMDHSESKIQMGFSGFHSCFDILATSSYFPINGDKTSYAMVKHFGDVITTDFNIVSSDILIIQEIDFTEILDRFTDFEKIYVNGDLCITNQYNFILPKIVEVKGNFILENSGINRMPSVLKVHGKSMFMNSYFYNAAKGY